MGNYIWWAICPEKKYAPALMAVVFLALMCCLLDGAGAAPFNLQRGNVRVKFNTGGYSTTTDQINPEISVSSYQLDLQRWPYVVNEWRDSNSYNIPDLHIRSTRGGSYNSTYYQAYDAHANFNQGYIRRVRMRWASGDYMGDQCEHSGIWGMIYGHRLDNNSWYGYHWWRPGNDPMNNSINWRGWSWYSFSSSHRVRRVQIRAWAGEHAYDGMSHIIALNSPPSSTTWHFNQWTVGMEVDIVDITYMFTATYYYSVENADYYTKTGAVDMGAKGLYWGKIWWTEGRTNGSSKRCRVYCRTSTAAGSGYGSWIQVYNGAPLMGYLTKRSESLAGKTYYWQKQYMQIRVNMVNPKADHSNRPYLSNLYVDYFYDNTLPYPWRHYGYRLLRNRNGSEGLWAQRDGSSQLTYTTWSSPGYGNVDCLEISRYNATVRLRNSSYDIPDLHIRTTRGSWHNDMYNAESAFTNPGITRVRMRFGSSGERDPAIMGSMGLVYGYRRDRNSWHGYYTWHTPPCPENNSISWHGWNWYSLMADSHRVSRVQLRSWCGEFEAHLSGASNHPNHTTAQHAILQWCYNEWAIPMEISHIDVYYDGTYNRYYDTGWWESGKKTFDAGTDAYKWSMITWNERDRAVNMKCRGSDDGSSYGGWSGTRAQFANLHDITNRYLQVRAEFSASGTAYPGPGTSSKLDWVALFFGVNRKPELQSLSISENIPSEWGNQDKRSQINYNDPSQASTFATTNPTSWVRVTYKIYDPDGDPCRTVDWQFKSDALSLGWTDIADGEKSGAHSSYRTAYPAKTYNDLQWQTLTQADGYYGDLDFQLRCKDELSLDGQTNLYTDFKTYRFFCDNNEPPTISAASFQILPDPAYTTDTLYINTSMTGADTDSAVTTCHAEADLPNLEFRSYWKVGGKRVGDDAPELAPENYVKGDTVVVEVYPFDSKEFGAKVTDSLTISNKPPVITKIELTPSQPYTTDDLMCTVVATDDDEFIWRNDDLKDATVEANQDPSGNVDGNVITTDVDGDNEWELQLR